MDRLEAAEAFLKAAQEDIRVANLAHERDLSRPCIYHLGQAVEKTPKSYLLGFSDVPVDSLKTHDGLLLHTTFLRWAINTYRQPLEGLLEVVRSSHSHSERELALLDILLAEKKIKSLRNHTSARQQEKEHLFPTYLEESHGPILEGQLTLCENLTGPDIFEKIEPVAHGLELVLGIVPEFRQDYLEAGKSHIGGVAGIVVLPALCGIFIFHDQDPRYPPLFSPPDTRWHSYKHGAPIVAAIPRLLDIVTKSHQLVSKMLSHSGRVQIREVEVHDDA